MRESIRTASCVAARALWGSGWPTRRERPASGSVIAPMTAARRRSGRGSRRRSSAAGCTPSASELLIEWSAMHGYSEPVLQRTMQSTKPRNPSGIRYCEEAEPVWARPNRMPVTIAATQTSRCCDQRSSMCHRRSAPKMKPRKKNSSAIGAITQTKTAAPDQRRRARADAQVRGELVGAVEVDDRLIDRGHDVVADAAPRTTAPIPSARATRR